MKINSEYQMGTVELTLTPKSHGRFTQSKQPHERTED